MGQEVSGWHLDKRVPITLIVVILLQTASFGWFVSGINSQVQTNTSNIELNRLDIKTVEDRNGAADVLLGRIDVQLTNLAQVLTRIERELHGDE